MATANVKEIARGLSLSPGTVSKALRGIHGLVSVDTAHQVLSYCAQKGYLNRLEAGRVMMQIKSRSTGSQIFAVTCRTGIGAYDEVFAGICQQLQSNELFSSCFLIHDRLSLKKFPYDRAEAVIVIGRVSPEIHDEFLSREVPLVLVDDRVAGSQGSAVNSNNLEAVSQAVRILADLGHKRIAFMCRYEDKPTYTYTFHQRKVGYLSGMANAGLGVHDELAVECNSATESPIPAYDDVIVRDLTMLSERIIKLDPLPTAVIAGNDLMACVLVDVLKRHRLRVPEDVSVIGYDGWNKLAPVSASGFVPTSTMVVNWREMGREASELALSMQFGTAQTPRYLEVPAVYEDYGTVASPRRG